MFHQLSILTERPQPFSISTRSELWTTPHIAKNMLEIHLNPDVNAASRKGDFIKASANFIIDRFHIKSGRSVIDFGCGPGLYTSRFAETGAKVTGLDFSDNSLDYAKSQALKKGLDIDYIKTDYLAFVPQESYDLITLIYCDYGAIGPEKRRHLLTVMKNCLKDDGYLFMDVDSMIRFNKATEVGHFGYSDGGSFLCEEASYQFTKSHKYEDEKIYLEHLTIVKEEAIDHIYNWMQCYTKASLEAELRDAGFEVIEWFDNIAGKAYTGNGEEMAVICKKIS